MAKMGFLDVIIASFRIPSSAAFNLDICSTVPKLATLSLAKLARSFPEEKLPPLPEMMINLTLLSSLAYLIRLEKLMYISEEKALYLLGRLKVI